MDVNIILNQALRRGSESGNKPLNLIFFMDYQSYIQKSLQFVLDMLISQFLMSVKVMKSFSNGIRHKMIGPTSQIHSKDQLFGEKRQCSGNISWEWPCLTLYINTLYNIDSCLEPHLKIVTCERSHIYSPMFMNIIKQTCM